MDLSGQKVEELMHYRLEIENKTVKMIEELSGFRRDIMKLKKQKLLLEEAVMNVDQSNEPFEAVDMEMITSQIEKFELNYKKSNDQIESILEKNKAVLLEIENLLSEAR